jgi:hypothetical protein
VGEEKGGLFHLIQLASQFSTKLGVNSATLKKSFNRPLAF